MSCSRHPLSRVRVLASLLLALVAFAARAQVIQPPYDTVYTLTDLGTIANLPTPYGGLDFAAGNPNAIIIGGAANSPSGQLFSVNVVRDSQNHIVGFSGGATLHSDGAFNDGGVVFGPGGVLFYTRFPTNEVGEVKPGSTITDKVVDLTPLGVLGPVSARPLNRPQAPTGAASSVGALNFVPAGLPGAGQLKIVSYDTGNWYTAAYSADGSGTYNITSAVLNTTIVGGPEGFIYVPTGSPVFATHSMLVSEYENDVVTTYQFDGSGNPNTGTRAVFISGLTGAEGAVIDPLSGDFLFSTFGAVNHVIVVRGFAIPVTPTPGPPPPPQTAQVPTLTSPVLALLGLALAVVAVLVIVTRRS